jgi:hypothetical protein
MYEKWESALFFWQYKIVYSNATYFSVLRMKSGLKRGLKSSIFLSKFCHIFQKSAAVKTLCDDF